jgi:hypothetical protein
VIATDKTEAWLAPCSGRGVLFGESRSAKDKKKSRARIWTKRIAIGVAVLWVIVVAGSNVFLKTSLFKDLMAFDPQAMTMEYESAYSWFPFRVHVDNLTVRGSDSHVQWLLTVDHADTFIWPWDFAKHRIHSSETHATGVSFVVRTRFAPEEITPDLLVNLPRIPGFSDPPLKIPVPPPPSDVDYNLWSADLEEVTADHVREIWIDTVRATGDIRVTGRWYFRPLRELDFGPSEIELMKVDINDGNLTIARDLDGVVQLRIFPFDVRGPQGLEMLDQFSGVVKMKATISVDGLDHLLSLKTAHLSDGEIALRTDVRIDHGVLASGSHAAAAILETKLRVSSGALQLAVKSALTATFDVDETKTLVGRTRTEGLVVSKAGAPPVSASLQAEITSRKLRLAHGFDDASFHLHATNIRTRSLEEWITPGDQNSFWATGVVNGDADLDVLQEPLRTRGNISFAMMDVTIAQDSLRIVTNLKGEAKIENASLDEKKFDGSIDAELHDVVANSISKSNVRLFSASQISVRAPELVITKSGVQGKVDVDMPRAESGDLATLHDLLPLPDTVKLVGGVATANARGEIDLASLSGHGEMNLVASRLDVQIDHGAVYGNLGLQLRAVRGANGTTDLSGSTLTFSRGDAPNAPTNAPPWSATFDAVQARLVTSPNPYLTAALRGTATDASPATMFISGSTGIPNWLANAFRMPGLKIATGLLIAERRIEVQNLDARGDNAFVRFEYSRMGAMKDGAMYVGAGPLAAGVDLAGGSGRLIVFGPEKWFAQDVAKIRRNETDRVLAP